MKINHFLSILTLGFVIALPSFATSTCKTSEIKISSLPFTATTNNKTYCLSKNLTYDATAMKSGNPIQQSIPSYAAITVAASNVVINLNGKTLTATNLLAAEGAIGIYSPTTNEKITVQNGTINGFDIGIVARAKLQSTVKKVSITNGKFYGISASADTVEIAYNSISSLYSRWTLYMSAIDVEKSVTANIYNNIIKSVKAKNANPVPDVLDSFYGAHGISAYEFQTINIYNNTLYSLVTKEGEFSYISFLNITPSTGIASVYNNRFTYPINYSASERKNLGFFMLANNTVSLYNNEYTGFLRNVIYPSNVNPSNMSYFNNTFNRYIFNDQYESLFPEGSATPLDAGGNEFIYHDN